VSVFGYNLLAGAEERRVNPMSPGGAFLVAVLLLLAPWALKPPPATGEIHGYVRFLWWLNALYCVLWHRLDIDRDDPLPAEGPILLISNHTCCIDHMLIQSLTRRLVGYMIARELYEIWLFKPWCATAGCIPVKRDGRDLSATRGAVRSLEAGRVLAIFPEGRITPASGRALGEGKPGVAFIAARAGVPVIPVYIWGTPPTNQIVASYFTPSRAQVIFGPPVDLSGLKATGPDGKADLDEVTVRLMAAIRALKDQVWGVDAPADVRDASHEGPGDARRPPIDPGPVSGVGAAGLRA
jgi:1-acyl-sn-glycerol-3-phosphate acyltransferase